MEFLTGLILGISIGFVWGVWRATQSFIERIINKPEEIKEIMSRVERLNKEEDNAIPEKNETQLQPVRAEFIDDVCYLYDHNDNFMAQGATVSEAMNNAEKRFPGFKFNFRINPPNESNQ